MKSRMPAVNPLDKKVGFLLNPFPQALVAVMSVSDFSNWKKKKLKLNNKMKKPGAFV